MEAALQFLQTYGYWLLFFTVMAEQLAIPIPASVVLLSMGALSGLGTFSFTASLALAALACVICDQIWYQLGKIRGHSILKLICRISLEPDSCVSSTKATFGKWGAWSLLFAKFVPGLSAIAAPMCGLTRMPLRKFMAADIAGSLIWPGTYLSLGYLFRNQLEDVAHWLARFGGWAGAVAALLVSAYIFSKFYERRRFLRGLRVARVLPEELRDMMNAGRGVAVIDLRDGLELEAGGGKIPGALWIPMPELESRKHELPLDTELIVYCS